VGGASLQARAERDVVAVDVDAVVVKDRSEAGLVFVF